MTWRRSTASPRTLSPVLLTTFRWAACAAWSSLLALQALAAPPTPLSLQEMVSTVQRIVDQGHGYDVDGDVFFDVGSLPGYGRLSGLARVRGSAHA